MKSNKIYYALIIFQLIFITLESGNDPIKLENNNVFRTDLIANEPKTLNFTKTEGIFNISILSLNKKVELTFTDVSPKPYDGFQIPQPTYFTEINFTSNTNQGKITFSSTVNVSVEITSVLSKGDYDKDPYFYNKTNHELDTEITMSSNNFIIFLENENSTETFDMKFKFNEANNILGKKATYGFLYLPNENNQYLALGKHYKDSKIGNLSDYTIDKLEFELKAKHIYYKKQNQDAVKTKFAFIFSIDSDKMVGTYSFSINSEIINIFLIVSIVIALVFAVITFFLIRRKQSAESANIEGNENLLKTDKGEGEGKEEKGENEKEEKEEGEEKDDKVINEDNAEQEQKKIEAAEN